jgi:hypothetical protein
VLLVNGFNGLGLATPRIVLSSGTTSSPNSSRAKRRIDSLSPHPSLTLRRLFRDQYRNAIFVGVGEVESSRMKGPEEVKQLEQQVAEI